MKSPIKPSVFSILWIPIFGRGMAMILKYGLSPFHRSISSARGNDRNHTGVKAMMALAAGKDPAIEQPALHIFGAKLIQNPLG
jgi:hypothetical protein